jgi:F-type H+-transporting ATPase subunit gamma
LLLREISTSAAPIAVVTIGRKGRDVMVRVRAELLADVTGVGDQPKMGDVLPAVRVAMDAYEKGEVDQVDLVFERFISVGRQQVTLDRLIPVEPPQNAEKLAADFEYEPEAKDVLDALLPRYVEGQVFRAVLENSASEQAARMIAARNASDNASDLIEDYTLAANKLRQTTITTELIEVVSGASALQG